MITDMIRKLFPVKFKKILEGEIPQELLLGPDEEEKDEDEEEKSMQ